MTAPLRADHDRRRRRRRARLGPLLDAATSTCRRRSARSAPTARRRSSRAAGCARNERKLDAPQEHAARAGPEPAQARRQAAAAQALREGHDPALLPGPRLPRGLADPGDDQRAQRRPADLGVRRDAPAEAAAKVAIARSKKRPSSLAAAGRRRVRGADRPAAVPGPARRAVPRLQARTRTARSRSGASREYGSGAMPRSEPVDGFRLAYERAGSGPPVVLLHGWPGDRTDYEAVVPLLAPDFEVVVPDLRGFGASDKHLEPPAEAYSAAAQARSVVGLIDELGLDRAAARRLRHRQPDRAGDRARRAGAGARARRLAAAAGRGRRVLSPDAMREFWYQVVPSAVADRGGARRRTARRCARTSRTSGATGRARASSPATSASTASPTPTARRGR